MGSWRKTCVYMHVYTQYKRKNTCGKSLAESAIFFFMHFLIIANCENLFNFLSVFYVGWWKLYCTWMIIRLVFVQWYLTFDNFNQVTVYLYLLQVSWQYSFFFLQLLHVYFFYFLFLPTIIKKKDICSKIHKRPCTVLSNIKYQI